jgi:hypothetical protein
MAFPRGRPTSQMVRPRPSELATSLAPIASQLSAHRWTVVFAKALVVDRNPINSPFSLLGGRSISYTPQPDPRVRASRMKAIEFSAPTGPERLGPGRSRSSTTSTTGSRTRSPRGSRTRSRSSSSAPTASATRCATVQRSIGLWSSELGGLTTVLRVEPGFACLSGWRASGLLMLC